MKNILIISESFEHGGSGHATKAIFDFFKKNFSTKILIPHSNIKDNSIVNYYNSLNYYIYFFSKIFLRIFSYLVSNDKFYFFNNVFQNSFFSAKKIKKKLNGFEPDYVLILWFEYILNYREILMIKKIFKAKIIIYPFDMNPFTGGCRYTQSCSNYVNNCNNCPAIKLNEVASKNFLLKKKTIRKIDPLFFFPSDFSLNFVDKTKILSDKIKKVKFYYPFNKINMSNINLDQFPNYNLLLKKKKKYKNLVFFGSQNGNEWRKGIFILNETLNVFKNNYPETFKNTMFVYCGMDSKQLINFKDSNFFIFKFIRYSEIFKIYELSDIMIIPSIQEWSSFMMSEAFFLKKYIICFDAGSSKDYIKEGFNGNICNPYNFSDTAQKLYEALTKKKKLPLSKFFINNIKHNNKKIISYLK